MFDKHFDILYHFGVNEFCRHCCSFIVVREFFMSVFFIVCYLRASYHDIVHLIRYKLVPVGTDILS